MTRIAVVVYGLVAAAAAVVSMIYLLGFIGVNALPKACTPVIRSVVSPCIDEELGGPADVAPIVDLALIALFALQHSGMARPGFKRIWTRIVPEPIERSTYVLFSSVALALLFWQWRPIPEVIRDYAHPPGRTVWQLLFWLGGAIGIAAALSMRSLESLGLPQVFCYARGKAWRPPRFQTPGIYRFVRHPMWLAALLMTWATPTITLGHVLFSTAMTLYFAIAIPLAERDLAAEYGNAYRRYRRRTPMLVPLTRWRSRR